MFILVKISLDFLVCLCLSILYFYGALSLLNGQMSIKSEMHFSKCWFSLLLVVVIIIYISVCISKFTLILLL